MNNISQRRINRYVEANKIVLAGDINSLIEKVMDMSPEQRLEFVKEFVSKHGINEVQNILTSFVTAITQKQAEAALYEGFNKEEKETKPSKIKQLLKSGEGWMFLLTLILMMAAIEQHYPVGQKSADSLSGIRYFLLSTGSAFITWAMNYIKHKIK